MDCSSLRPNWFHCLLRTAKRRFRLTRFYKTSTITDWKAIVWFHDSQFSLQHSESRWNLVNTKVSKGSSHINDSGFWWQCSNSNRDIFLSKNYFSFLEFSCWPSPSSDGYFYQSNAICQQKKINSSLTGCPPTISTVINADPTEHHSDVLWMVQEVYVIDDGVSKFVTL